MMSKSKPRGNFSKCSLTNSRNLRRIRLRCAALLLNFIPTKIATRTVLIPFGRKRKAISGSETDLPRLKTACISSFRRKQNSFLDISTSNRELGSTSRSPPRDYIPTARRAHPREKTMRALAFTGTSFGKHFER